MTARDLDGVQVTALRVGDGAAELLSALGARGAVASSVQVATVTDRSDAEVRAEIGDLARFAWVAVTSTNAARRLALWASEWPEGLKVGAVGPTTAQAVASVGLRVASIAPDGTASSLAEQLSVGPVLFLAASSARDDLPRSLAERGIDVVTVVAYDVVARELDDDDARVLARSDALVAMSPIALDALGALAGATRDALIRVPLVAIGPTTAQHARDLGWHVSGVAQDRAVGSVCDAVVVAVSG
ncbi:MAG TPA: uroporphyrinogen-III synthase [Acidimicrobiales bacterium]